MQKPTDEQKALLSIAALEAVYAKAGELGLPRLFGLYGITGAMESIKALAMLYDIIGEEGLTALSDALMQREKADAVRQAEDILKGEQYEH